jgi:hypothetical protein
MLAAGSHRMDIWLANLREFSSPFFRAGRDHARIDFCLGLIRDGGLDAHPGDDVNCGGL